MTDTALAPIDANPLAFQANLSGAVLPTADRCAKFAVRTALEVTEDTFTRLAILAREKTPIFCVLVPDAESMDEVTIPEKPKTEDSKGTKKSQTPSSLHRFALETLADEMDVEPKEFYAGEMKKSTAKVWERIEDVRREKAFMGQGTQ